MTIQDLVDKQAAIIAARDATIAEKQDVINQMREAAGTISYHEIRKTRLELERFQTQVVPHLQQGQTNLLRLLDEKNERIELLEIELRRRIEEDRDEEIETSKLLSGWAWPDCSIKDGIAKKYEQIAKEYGL